MLKKMLNPNWFILLVFILLLAACGSETPIAQPPPAEQPVATTTQEATALPPVNTEIPTEIPPETEPEAEPTEAMPEISQPVARWSAVSEQGNWVLVGYGDALNPVVVESGTYVTINFSATDDRVNGSGVCNNYFTSYVADDDGNLTINGPVASTLMACETGMEQETLFLAALESVKGYTVADNGYLLLDYSSGADYSEQLVLIPESPLVDTIWVLTGYGNPENLVPSEAGVMSTLIFASDGRLSGNAGCNNYSAEYSLDGTQMTMGLPISNRMACIKGMDQEQAFLQLLEAAQSYRLGVNALEIMIAGGTKVMRFSAQHLPLENVRWQLTSINKLPLPKGTSANLLFTPADSPAAHGDENSINGQSGCNNFFGTYTLSGDRLTAGPLGVTQMMCDELTMQVEQDLLAGLEDVQSYQILLDQLTINTSNGSMQFSADRLPLEGPRWILTGSGSIENPQPPLAGSGFTANFDRQFGMPSGVKSGGTGCNDYKAIYFAGFSEIKVNLPQTDQNTCSNAQSEAEQGYFLGLNAARDYRILGNELQIFYGDQMLFFVGSYPQIAGEGPLTPLDGTEWQLTSIDTKMVLPDSEVTILFDINPDGSTGTISGSGGCNTYNARIEQVFALSPIIVSTAICDSPAGVMEQEGAYLTALQEAKDIWIGGDRLRIRTNQETLYFIMSGPGPEQPGPTPGAPQAVIVAPGNVLQGQVMTFDGSLSTPADQITAYHWWFSDETTAEGILVERSFASTGFYDAILTITTASGDKSDASVKVSIHYPLIGPVWRADGGITLNFKDGVLSGNAGCNDYSASYTAAMSPGGPNDISVDTISTTGKVCDGEVMNQEQLFLARLKTASSYTINIKSMIITTTEGSLSFNGSAASP